MGVFVFHDAYPEAVDVLEGESDGEQADFNTAGHLEPHSQDRGSESDQEKPISTRFGLRRTSDREGKMPPR